MNANLDPTSNPHPLWTRKHLLGLEDLSREEIIAILDTAESFSEISTRNRKKVPAKVEEQNTLYICMGKKTRLEKERKGNRNILCLR